MRNTSIQQKVGTGDYGNWTNIPDSDKDTASHLIRNLSNGTDYAFKIRVMNADGGSVESDEVTVTPKIAPARPIISKVVPGDGVIRLTVITLSNASAWQSQCKIGDGDFESWVSAAGDADPGNSNNTIITISNLDNNTRLTNNTSYICKVRALNEDVQGLESAETTKTTPHQKPSAPSNLSLTPGNGRVVLQWKEPSNIDNSLIIKYQYQQSTDKNNQSSWGIWNDIEGNSLTTREHVVTGLTNGATYYFRIRAVTAGYESDQSPRVGSEPSATPNAAPATPQLSGDLERKGTQVTLSWTYTPNGVAVGYWQYWQRESGAPVWGDWSRSIGGDGTSTYNVTGLDNSKAYDFQVRASTTGDVAGEESNTSSVPIAPTSLSAAPGVGFVTLNWTTPSGNPAGSYRYQYCYNEGSNVNCDNNDNNDKNDWKNIPDGDATTTSHDVTGLKGNTQYTFKVRVVSSTGGSAESNDASGTTVSVTASPDKPEDLSATGGNGQVMLTWTDSDDLSIQKYQIQQKEGDGDYSDWTDIPNSSARTTSYTVPDLTNGTEYAFKIRAVNAASSPEGPASEEVTATPTSPPAPVSALTLVLDTTSISENGGVATVTAMLDKSLSSPTTVSITATPVAPAVAGDFTLSGNTELIIAAGETSSTGTVTITANNTNSVHEANKTVTITATTNNNVSVTSALTLTIKDDDGPTVSLALDPAEISEDGGVTTVTASLDKPATSTTTVSITAVPVSPAVVGDFTLSENTELTIATGATSSTGTVSITAVDNDVEGADKTITISATAETADAQLGVNNPAAVTLTIIEDDGVSMEQRKEAATKVLAGVARATLAGATSAIDQRFDAAPGGPAALSVADWQVGDTLASNTSLWERLERWDGDLTMVNRLADLAEGVDLLTESNFSVALNPAGGGTWSIWGRGDWRGFEGNVDQGSYDGSQRAGYLGVDKWLNERLMAGLALSHSTSETDYSIEDEGGRIDTSLTSIWPYLQNTMDNGAQLRLVLGIGKGEVEHYPTGEADEQTDLTMRAVSVAGKLPVAQPGDFTLSATAAASLADMKTEGLASVAAINGLHVSSWNLRAGVEAKHEGFPVSETQWTLTPRVALALRQDGGDGVSGTGAELSGGLRLAAPDSRFALDGSAYWLVLHSQDGTKEWGASLEARFSPGEGGGGLSFNVAPTLGAPYQDGVLANEGLFEEERSASNLGNLSLTAHAGYGFALPSGLLTPFAEFTLPGEAEATRYAAGVNFAAPGGLDAKLSGERQDDDTRVGIDLSVDF